MVKWEYGELYKLYSNEPFYFNGKELLEEDRYRIYNVSNALSVLGELGWELIMKERDDCGNNIYRMKRVKCEFY